MIGGMNAQAGLGGSGNPLLSGGAAMPPASNGMGPTQEDVFGLLKNNLLRRFKIDIETDSTVAGDESQEKQDRTDFIEAITKFFETWGPMVMQMPILAPLSGKILLFGTRAFRVGRELEEEIEETVDKLSQPQPQSQQPDPKVQAEQIKLQSAQLKVQGEQSKAQIEGQTKQQESAIKLREIILQSEARIREAQMKLAAMEQAHGHKIVEGQMEHAATMDQMALERQKAQTAVAAAQMPKWPTNPGTEQGF